MTTADDADSSWGLRKYGAAQTLAAEGLVRFGNTLRIVFSHVLFVAAAVRIRVMHQPDVEDAIVDMCVAAIAAKFRAP